MSTIQGVCGECSNCDEFESPADARARIEACRVDYDNERPHSTLGYLTPKEYVILHQSAEAGSG